jgi:hypothetical protein
VRGDRLRERGKRKRWEWEQEERYRKRGEERKWGKERRLDNAKERTYKGMLKMKMDDDRDEKKRNTIRGGMKEEKRSTLAE